MQTVKILKRTAIVLLIIAAVVILYGIFEPKLKILSNIATQYSKAETPGIYLLPQTRDVKAVDDTDMYEAAEIPALKFKSPWGKPDKDSDEAGKSEYKLSFDNGMSVVVRDKSDSSLSASYMRTSNFEEKEKVKKYYGADSINTDFKLNKAVLEASPDQISLFKPTDEIAAKHVMLKYKLFMPLNNISDIYIFELDNVKGFQFGNPEKNDTVQLLFYDVEDNEYSMAFIGSGLSQEDIDVILSTMVFN